MVISLKNGTGRLRRCMYSCVAKGAHPVRSKYRMHPYIHTLMATMYYKCMKLSKVKGTILGITLKRMTMILGSIFGSHYLCTRPYLRRPYQESQVPT